MSSDTLTAAVVGCGVIGGGHADFSHAAAYHAHAKFDLIACIDPNSTLREQFQAEWSVPHGFSQLEDMYKAGITPDVVSVAVPTAYHQSVLETLLDHRPLAVFCEKPLTGNIEVARNIVEKYKTADIPLAINFHRRWDPSIQNLKLDLESGRWGKVLSIAATYTKGIWQNGSHILDLVEYLAGPLELVAITGSLPGLEDDPTVDAVLRTKKGANFHLIAQEHAPYYILELTLNCERGSVSLENAGLLMRERNVDDDPMFPGEVYLTPGNTRPTEQHKAFYYAVDNIYRTLNQNQPLLSTGETALTSLQLCSCLSKETGRE